MGNVRRKHLSLVPAGTLISRQYRQPMRLLHIQDTLPSMHAAVHFTPRQQTAPRAHGAPTAGRSVQQRRALSATCAGPRRARASSQSQVQCLPARPRAVPVLCGATKRPEAPRSALALPRGARACACAQPQSVGAGLHLTVLPLQLNSSSCAARGPARPCKPPYSC